MTLLFIALVLAIGLLLYAWAGYPVLLALHPARKAGVTDSPPDRRLQVSILLSAFNEEEVIASRLENLFSTVASCRKPARFTIHVGVDGATDRTAQTAASSAAGRPNSHIHAFPHRRGKVAVLRDLVAAARQADSQATGDESLRILVFTDANTFFGPESLDHLLTPFANPRVGGVCGRLEFRHAAPADADSVIGPSPESAYWDWETWFKKKESAVDSCLGANGAIYAMREELFWDDIPDNTIVDDFVIGLKVREKGFRMLYEPAATAVEELPEIASEWTRRVRIGAGDFQALVLCRRCLMPEFGRFAWMLWSHKVLRWLTPHLCLLALASALMAILFAAVGPCRGAGLDAWLASPTRWLPLLVAVAAAGFLSCSLAGRLWRRSNAAWARPFQLCEHFTTMQAALFAGFIRFCRGNLAGHWTRTPRRDEKSFTQLPRQAR